jgi:hypothetical protein
MQLGCACAHSCAELIIQSQEFSTARRDIRHSSFVLEDYRTIGILVHVLILYRLSSREPDVDKPFCTSRGVVSGITWENEQVRIIGCAAKETGIAYEVGVLALR